MIMPFALVAAAYGASAAKGADEVWATDFAAQPVGARPRLEARYVDATRQAAEILGERYEIALRLAGEGAGQATVSERDGSALREAARISLEVETADHASRQAGGKAFSSLRAGTPSRINIYRRGPYYIELHWLDVACAADAGEDFPAKGEVVFYCYPEKVHVQAIWHGVGPAGAGTAAIAVRVAGGKDAGRLVLSVKPDGTGMARASTSFDGLKEGDKVAARLAFEPRPGGDYPVSIEEPLPAGAVEVLDGLGARYDAERGCYMVGSENPGGFNYHYYENPNHYETARFRIRNDERPRKVYVCHETAKGAAGSVECGVLLDGDDDPLPITVQISKNFSGEKEEPFYNPEDTAFSETVFPLYLKPDETREMTSLHLYQNWGDHPLKQFSSLGAWMDYYHSSTGVTETTCFVPFKFGGLGGVAIADLRPMSQRMWTSQPQHDNVAGHRFLMYRADGGWHYAVYRGTTFRSTGPNWMDMSLDYVSDDGRVRARLDSFEVPQTDQLRNFIRLRCEVLAPVRIERLATDFRLMDITSRIQRLRYKHAAWQSAAGQVATRDLEEKDTFAPAGERLGGRFPWATVYGDKRGCNSFVVRGFRARLGGRRPGPAVTVQTYKSGDMDLALTPAGGEAELKPGDFVEAEFYIMPYGDDRNTCETPEADRVPFGVKAPRVIEVSRGRKMSDFPCRVRASRGRAEFEVAGGRNAIPIIVEGLPTYKRPRLEARDAKGAWKPVPQETMGDDGRQVFVDDRGSFGCVFLVQSDGTPRTYRVAVGQRPAIRVRGHLRPSNNPLANVVEIQAPWMDSALYLRYPETINTAFGLLQIDHYREDMIGKTDVATLSGWHEGPGRSQWFDWGLAEQCKAGGIVSPGQDEVRLEFWFYNGQDRPTSVSMQYCLPLGNGMFRDTTGERTYIHVGGKWVRMADTDRGAGRRELVHYPVAGGEDLGWLKPGVGGWGASSDVADVGLVAVKATDGKHVLGLAWEHPRAIVSNWLIPCIHADPIWPECGAGKRERVRGKLYLMEGGLDDVLARYRGEGER
jgi:hypothetical protein